MRLPRVEADQVRTTADAVIVGGGVMGCSILHALARRGLRETVLLERGVLSSGSTGRSQGILRMHYSNEVTSRMAWESLRIFKSFDEEVGGSSGYVNAGYLLIVGQGDRASMEENAAMQRGVGVRTEVLSADRVRDVAPAFSVQDDEACAYEPESGYADPYLVTHAYAAAAKDLGGEIRVAAPVTGIQTAGGRVTGVMTNSGSISTRAAVVAAGPWSRPLLGAIGIEAPLETVRHQVVMLRRPRHRISTHPVVGDVVNSFSARPDAGGVTLVALGEEERAEPDSYDQGVDAGVVEDVLPRLVRRMPGMEEAVFRGGWSGLFTTTPDWHPILDAVPGIEGLYVAVGFSGHGFKLAPMVGVAMSEMVVDGRASTIDVSALGLSRFQDGARLRSRYGMSVLA